MEETYLYAVSLLEEMGLEEDIFDDAVTHIYDILQTEEEERD